MVKFRTYVDGGPDTSGPEFTPKHITKQEFARRLYRLLVERGWTQSELARQSGLARDAISTYVRSKALPSPQSLQKLAKALKTTPEALLPNHLEYAIDEEDNPAFSMQASNASPGKAWVRVNRLVSFSTATKIAELLENDASN